MKTKQLISLINSLTKSEKRNFKLQSQKTGNRNKLYVVLFDWIEKNRSLEEDKLLKKHPRIKKSQLPNLKNILYHHILKSLRETSKDTYDEIQAREQFDFAKILYSKGDYTAALKYLQKAKHLAGKIKKSPLTYLALDFEKQIESHHITGSMANRASELVDASQEIIEEMQLTDQLSNLSLLLYGRYLKRGFVKNETDFNNLSDFFYSHLPHVNEHHLNFQQKLYLYQSYVWYYYMTQNFAYNYKYAKKWALLFEEYPEMMTVDTSSYLKALHNVLSALFVANKKHMFQRFYNSLYKLNQTSGSDFNINEKLLYEMIYYVHLINRIFLFADYETGLEDVAIIEKVLEQKKNKWDDSRMIVFYYKIACVYFGNDDYEKAILWLNKIINKNYGDIKQDIQCYARILSLITHYEMGNELLVSNQIVSVYRFLLKMKDLGKVQREIFIFLRKSAKVRRSEIMPEFVSLRENLLRINADKFERRAYLYLDLISWLDSKIKEITMVEAIRINERLVGLSKSQLRIFFGKQ